MPWMKIGRPCGVSRERSLLTSPLRLLALPWLDPGLACANLDIMSQPVVLTGALLRPWGRPLSSASSVS